MQATETTVVSVPNAPWRAALSWSPLLLCVAWLIYVSYGALAPVASGVIRWASARIIPVLTSAAVTYLAWAGRGQAQRLWVAALASIRRHAPRKRPATYGDLGRDRGAPVATRGLP